jgi:hypothetical protein
MRIPKEKSKMDNPEWQHMKEKQNKNTNAICVEHHYTQTNTQIPYI